MDSADMGRKRWSGVSDAEKTKLASAAARARWQRTPPGEQRSEQMRQVASAPRPGRRKPLA